MANDETYWNSAEATFPSTSTIAVALCSRRSIFFFVPTSVAPYSIIPSVMDCRFCGVLLNYHFGPREAGKLIDELFVPRYIYCSEHVSSTCWPHSWRRRRFVFRAFFPLIYTVLIPHFFLISSLLIIERDRHLLLSSFLAPVNKSSVPSSSVSIQTFLQSIF